jgi:hypothetical protein
LFWPKVLETSAAQPAPVGVRVRVRVRVGVRVGVRGRVRVRGRDQRGAACTGWGKG